MADSGAPSPLPVLHAPVGHDSAPRHVSGEAVYIDDIPEPPGLLHLFVGQAARAHARVSRLDLAAVRAAPGVVAVLTPDDIPGRNDCGPVVHDDPILADGGVQFAGQPVFAVAATSVEAVGAIASDVLAPDVEGTITAPVVAPTMPRATRDFTARVGFTKERISARQDGLAARRRPGVERWCTGGAAFVRGSGLRPR